MTRMVRPWQPYARPSWALLLPCLRLRAVLRLSTFWQIPLAARSVQTHSFQHVLGLAGGCSRDVSTVSENCCLSRLQLQRCHEGFVVILNFNACFLDSSCDAARRPTCPHHRGLDGCWSIATHSPRRRGSSVVLCVDAQR